MLLGPLTLSPASRCSMFFPKHRLKHHLSLFTIADVPIFDNLLNNLPLGVNITRRSNKNFQMSSSVVGHDACLLKLREELRALRAMDVKSI